MPRQSKAFALFLLGLIVLRSGSRLALYYRLTNTAQSLPAASASYLPDDDIDDDDTTPIVVLRPLRHGVRFDVDTTPQPNLLNTLCWQPSESAQAFVAPVAVFQNRLPDPLVHPPA